MELAWVKVLAVYEVNLTTTLKYLASLARQGELGF
jgi:hypothetical protein